MLNEFRSWLRPEGTDSPDGDQLRIVDRRAPLSFVLDPDAASLQTLATVLHGCGIETSTFSDAAGFVQALPRRTPHMVFVDVAAEGEDAIDVLFALGERSFRGPVQLIGARTVTVIETVRRMGERHSLTMLPPLRKPLDAATIRQLIQNQRLDGAPLPPTKVGLAEALRNGWTEFWYQPKIDLRRKQIAGVETFARVRHPEFGTLPPGAFMPGADESSITALTEKALVTALTAASNFSQLGINLRLAVNISMSALVSLPIAEMVKQYGPKKINWPGLILDVTEEQIVADLPLVKEVSERLSAFNIKLAIDDFGRGQLSLAKLRDLSFAELKLDRAFVTNCGSEKANASICKTVVELAHSLGSIAVAIGVEKPGDVHALQAMNCDLGQGFLFGQPMPEDQLLALLRERSITSNRAAAAPRVSGRA